MPGRNHTGRSTGAAPFCLSMGCSQATIQKIVLSGWLSIYADCLRMTRQDFQLEATLHLQKVTGIQNLNAERLTLLIEIHDHARRDFLAGGIFPIAEFD